MLASQRKAWNDAMRSAVATIPGSSSLSLARRSDRQKKHMRREKARKGLDQLESTTGQKEYRAAAHIDALEDVVIPEEEDDADGQKDDEEYVDDEDEDDQEGGASDQKQRKRRRKTGVKKKQSSIKQRSSSKIPKRWKPRSLASILMEEASRPNGGVVKKYIAAEARPIPPFYPLKKICPVSGLFANYTDPKSGVPYANLKALSQIQERVPPWITVGGATAYAETIKTLTNE
jgi:hypothetical protein